MGFGAEVPLRPRVIASGARGVAAVVERLAARG
jgi:hypothetical protein